MANEITKANHNTPKDRVILLLAEMIKKYGDNVLAKIETKQK